MPLRIVIAGAGIAGLTAAIALAPAGHRVTIVEKSAFATEIGAAFHLGPYGVRLLKRLGVELSAMRYIVCESYNRIDARTLEVMMNEFELETTKAEYGVTEDEIMLHRIDAHNVLRETAEKNSNVEIVLGDGLADVDPSSGLVTLVSSKEIQADVVIGADGVHSRAVVAIDPDRIPPIVENGVNMFRWMVPISEARKHPELSDLLDKLHFPAWHSAIIDKVKKQMLVVYSCRDGQLINCATFQPAESESKRLSPGDYKSPGSVEEVLHLLDGWLPPYRTLASLADDVKHWGLISRDLPVAFNKDRLVLMGDAAHPMHPKLAAGANSGIEDAAVLSVLLGTNVTPEKVADRLELYNKLRYRRMAMVKYSSEITSGDMAEDEAQFKRQFQSKFPGEDARPIERDYLWKFDAMENAREALAAHVA